MKKIVNAIALITTTTLIFLAHAVIDPDILYLDQTTIIGSMQFPSVIRHMPPTRIYYAGNKITTDLDHAGKKINFELSVDKRNTTFYLVISKDVTEQRHEVVEHLKIAPHAPYLFYEMELVTELKRDDKGNTIKETHWEIQQEQLPKNGILPDHTIIVSCNPEWIDRVEGITPLRLPSIVVKNSLLQLVGSEDALHEHAVEQLLASLDNDRIHASIKSDVKQNYQKTIVAMKTP
jgi:hypothetical protein